MADAFRDALPRLEQALTEALERVTAVGTPAEIESLIKLLIKKKIVTEMLLDKIETLEAYDHFGPLSSSIRSDSQIHPSEPLVSPVENQPDAELKEREKSSAKTEETGSVAFEEQDI